MIKYLGKVGNLSLFSEGSKSVVIDTNLNMVSDISEYDSLLLFSSQDLSTEEPAPTHVFELATAALTPIDQGLTAAGSRMYTIPGGVQSEAKKALEWRKEHKRGGTPVGLNTARTLAKGGQIGIKKIRHIAKFFPRHEKNKQAKGWDPGEDGYPSNGKIAWALWGGDAGQRWSSAIVERENKKSIAAGGYALAGYDDDFDIYQHKDSYDSDVNAFKMAHELDPHVGPEFMCRIRLDNSGIDRLYKIEINGQVYLWDGSGWDDMGHVDGDVYSYDQALDEQEDSVEKTHVLIDPSSAIIISAFMQERPFQPVTLDEIDPEETALMAKGVFGEDFEMIDRVMSAAGQKPSDQKGLTDGDGVFTPDERSKLAEAQPRDATGLFVKTGSRVVIAGDTARGSGVLESIDHKNKKVNVKLDSGRTIAVDPKLTKPESKVKPVAPVGKPQGTSPAVSMSGILGNTKDKTKREKARLPEGMTTLGKKDIASMLDTWSKRVDIASKARPGDGKNMRKERNYIIQDGKLVEQEGRKAPTQKPEAKAPAKESERIDQARRSKLQEKEGPKVPVQESQRIDQARGSKLKEKEGPKVPTTSGDGTYVVKKNDSLWSIAEKTKAAGQSTEDQWLKILEANKGKLRSDDPNLIFPDEKISIPNQKPVSAQEKIRAAKQADTKNNKGRK
jgi:hypothetical protein